LNVHPLCFFDGQSPKGAERIEIETANRRIGSFYPFAMPSGNDRFFALTGRLESTSSGHNGSQPWTWQLGGKRA
jgi:hypothetical protein